MKPCRASRASLAVSAESGRVRGIPGGAGMTLVEILVVLALVAVVLSAIAGTVGGVFGSRLVQGTSKMTGMVRYAYDLASLRGQMHRVVVDLEAGEYFIEAVEEKKECELDLENKQKIQDEGKKKEGEELASAGQMVTDMLVRKEKLPKGISFVRLYAKHNKQAVESGQDAIYFFPDGTAEKAMVWVTDGDDVFTVEVKALQGTAVVWKEDLDTQELAKR